MTDKLNTEEEKSQLWQNYHRHHKAPEPIEDKGRTYVLRQWLNVIFIVMAIAGLILYFNNMRETGTYLMIGSCVPKFIELSLRIMKI